jgi:sugar transferase (PEP-CTERM/EpsH1 system associated)
MSKPPLLYLAHRIPYPPNKGDKVRSFNLLRYLSTRYRVLLGTFVDDPADWQHVERLREWCDELHCEPLAPRQARIASLRGLLIGEALSLPYYRNVNLANWVKDTLTRNQARHAVVFSSPMAQYLEGFSGLHIVADYCDVDSAKWTAYADSHRGPLGWLYRREGRCLLAYERSAAANMAAVTFVSEDESDLFRRLAPESAARVHAISNGVDAAFFAPGDSFASPYQSDEKAVVFTGAMDYWPNVDAVKWFASEVWPEVQRREPAARFFIVGMNPSAEVKALGADPNIRITGTVPNIRPYLQHAAVIVAPLRIARGIQNKVLEAMAMQKAVVASSDAATGIDAQRGEELVVVDDMGATAKAVYELLSQPERALEIGRRARACVLARYSWEAHLRKLDPLLEGTPE